MTPAAARYLPSRNSWKIAKSGEREDEEGEGECAPTWGEREEKEEEGLAMKEGGKWREREGEGRRRGRQGTEAEETPIWEEKSAHRPHFH